MLERAWVRRLLLAPPTLRSSLFNAPVSRFRLQPFKKNSSSLQSVTQPSFWAGLIPKPLRRSSGRVSKKPKSKEWNPATFFIIILLLIGSMSIQMIALRHDFSSFSRRADVRIELLREIIERVQKGEEVDVEGLLGSGDPAKEKEWEEVMKQIEKEDELWEEAQVKKAKRRAVVSDNKASLSQNDTKSTEPPDHILSEVAKVKTKSNAPSGFY